jgi:hypothetical protein
MHQKQQPAQVNERPAHLHEGTIQDFMSSESCSTRGRTAVYIRGRYELQLQVGGTIGGVTAGRRVSRDLRLEGCGLLRGQAPENGRRSAIVVGNRITAWMNGVRIHNNAELPAMTGGALDNDETAPGPMMLQGDHSRVTYRKLVVTPITKAGM